jgi:hypothetical protein
MCDKAGRELEGSDAGSPIHHEKGAPIATQHRMYANTALESICLHNSHTEDELAFGIRVPRTLEAADASILVVFLACVCLPLLEYSDEFVLACQKTKGKERKRKWASCLR